MNNGDNNQTNNIEPGKETIEAAKVYKLNPENAPKEIPKTEVPIWQKSKEERQELQEQKAEEAPQPVVIEKKVKSKNIIARILFIVIIIMGAYIVYNYFNNLQMINTMKALSSPISTLGEEKELELTNPIVIDLYNKVKTNIREDIAENELNDSLKMYLAYRQIPHDRFYESNCMSFDNSTMVPFTCNNSNTKLPNAFKQETLQVEYVKLFGENNNFSHQNIQIGRNCIGGYQYIESRGEYVQGFCTEQATTIYRAAKTLVKATSKESTITLVEEVKYSASEGQTIPETLKSGTYIYTFKLDKNYNYIYISKVLKQED